jgi:Subtilase family
VMPPRSVAVAAAVAAALAAAPAARAATHVPDFTVVLPGDATAASVKADPDTWIVGAVPGRRTAALAKRFGARGTGLAQAGGYVVARGRARAFAAALRAEHRLVYAQANVLMHLGGVREDPLANGWRPFVVSAEATPPTVTAGSPTIALVDAQADMTHREWTGDANFTSLGHLPLTSVHGTATAAVAAAPANGIGMDGVWPGARAVNSPLRDAAHISCSESADGIRAAIANIASTAAPVNPRALGVINMSYGAQNSICLPEYADLEIATSLGIVPVAAVGNEGNKPTVPLDFPASLPHVLTVGATGPQDQRVFFSNPSPAIDLSAPGIGIVTAVPPAFDKQAPLDGYEALSGTSFSTPMVSAGVAWVAQKRRHLFADQVAQVIRRSARDTMAHGWDVETGFGVLDIDRALKLRAPAHDPLEPNENIVLVNGTFSLKGRFIWRGRRRAGLAATVNPWEDPIDVYRIRVPAHSRAHVTAAPRVTGIELAAFSSRAASVNDTPFRVRRSHRAGGKTERIAIRNRSSRARVFYLEVSTQGVAVSRDIRYTLRIR